MGKKVIRLVSWNVNGLRACIQKGFFDWLEHERPQIVCLQETKASEDILAELFKNHTEYECHFSSATKAGYSGTGILIRKDFKPLEVTKGLGIDAFDSEGRTIIVEFEKFFLMTGYFPNGREDLSRVPYKISYSETSMKHMLALQKKTKKEIIMCGDFNTAHTEIDLANPKANEKSTGFLPIERAWLTKYMSKGFIDIFRELHPNEKGHYSWWTYRFGCRAKNIGWRIDYFFITEGLRKLVKTASIDAKVMGSDHAPIYLDILLP